MKTVDQLLARTAALRRALCHVHDRACAADLLFLEKWELDPEPGAAAALRIVQLRRANPDLAAEIRAELARGRPLTPSEREALKLPGVAAARHHGRVSAAAALVPS